MAIFQNLFKLVLTLFLMYWLWHLENNFENITISLFNYSWSIVSWQYCDIITLLELSLNLLDFGQLFFFRWMVLLIYLQSILSSYTNHSFNLQVSFISFFLYLKVVLSRCSLKKVLLKNCQIWSKNTCVWFSL